MLDCTLLLAKCMVVVRNSIAYFVVVVSFVLTTRACSKLTHEAVERRC